MTFDLIPRILHIQHLLFEFRGRGTIISVAANMGIFSYSGPFLPGLVSDLAGLANVHALPQRLGERIVRTKLIG
jgi:hypothetical protein